MARHRLSSVSQPEVLESVGATVLANACGPCIGQWQREDIVEGERNTIVTSFNRNFRGRNDANVETLGFIGSPELVMALALGGRLSFNPLEDKIQGKDGETWVLRPPAPAPDIPPDGFVRSVEGYQAPPEDGGDVEVKVSPDSERLQLLVPFEPLPAGAYSDLALLMKTRGKTTTDHISPAGAWLRFRGHLDNLSDNMFLGAVNAFTDEPGTGRNQLSGEQIQPIPEIAREYKAQGMQWIAIGDNNYGEGSSREHAAMSPRMLGAAAVITRSFARIHEANLKKQGVLPLTFEDPGDYDRIRADDRLSIIGLANLVPGQPLVCVVAHEDGEEERINLRHTMNPGQIDWFKAGSAMNHMKNMAAS